jgi:ribosome-binding protein aMBF1 (putative translation factor)
MVTRDEFPEDFVMGQKMNCDKCKKEIEDDTKHIVCEQCKFEVCQDCFHHFLIPSKKKRHSNDDSEGDSQS